ncbi:FG-GAP-like repeat-containing protein [Rhodopirellula bahusiensis]
MAIRIGQNQLASRLIGAALENHPSDPQVLELAGDIQSVYGNYDEAGEFYSFAIDNTPRSSPSLFDKLGRSLMRCSRPFDAVSTLKVAVEFHPDSRSLRADLAGLLAALGCEFEAKQHLQWLVMRGFSSVNELSMLSDITRSQADEEMCRVAMQANVEDLRPAFGLSREKVFRRDWHGLSLDLSEVVSSHPNFSIAQAYYGRAIAELQDQSAIDDWLPNLPITIEGEPQYWMAIGIHAERHGHTKSAARAYWEACQINVDDAEALSRLAHTLSQLGMTQEGMVCATRAGQVSRLREQVDSLHEHHNDSQTKVVEIAKTLQSLGRLWEAAAWLRVGAGMTQDVDPSLPAVYSQLRERLTSTTPWQLPEHNVVGQLNLTEWPVADWHLPKRGDRRVFSAAAKSNTRIEFVDVAESRGLAHTCSIEPPKNNQSGVWVYQTAAGGAAAIDFDLDGWPDVCLSAMDGSPLALNSSPNRLFRNESGRFEDVTDEAEMGDRGFTQGISVGDINLDGFDDLCIANIGANSIYLNCGDGTFRESPKNMESSDCNWTSSVALVDLNQDGLTDIFEVNYCDVRETLDQPCVEQGKANPCRPSMFTALPDRVWLGTSDGGFVEGTEEWLGQHDAGRGFGLVTGFFDDQPGIDVYVANDMTANHFWSHGAPKSDESLGNLAPLKDKDSVLSNQAYVRGVAVDRSSRSQASMGIAAGDPDNDGDIDFYVTHYEGEYNTYYEQDAPGIWADVSESNGHSPATMDSLGFGTQFIDADNDGTLELIVANGHVMKQSGRGFAEPMRSQIMTQTERGNWHVQSDKKESGFFTTKRVSRSLINLDFDRDGRMDCLMTHMGEPVSLLSNQTKTKKQSIVLHLKGTQCNPNAIGATASVKIGDKTVRKQLIGGGGFQCSNQRCLSFGLGDFASGEGAIVSWPSGNAESFDSELEAGEWLLVEGSGAATWLSR